jgi:GNAT superfamily N-acetyltransferase
VFSIRTIQLPLDGFEPLAHEARAEAYHFIERLQEDWDANRNRYSGEGEVLLGVFCDGQLVALGGLNRDPFTDTPGVGRLRHVYVRSAWRRRGIGEALVAELLQRARLSFRETRLHADNPVAIRLYEGMGFTPFTGDRSTHRLVSDSAQPVR